jgi:cell division protease FtsH
MKSGWQYNLGIYLLVIMVVVGLLIIFIPRSEGPEEIPISQVYEMAQGGELEKIVIEGDTLHVTASNGSEYISYKEADSSIIDNIKPEWGVLVEVKPVGFNWGGLLASILPLVVIGIFLFFLFSQAKGVNNQAMNFGRSTARMVKGGTPKVTFDDVAGIDEAKQDVAEVVEFLKHREKFQKLGARIPRGILLIGPPGTGKTLLAKAIAGEAGVSFFSISGSEFVEMFVGVGASRVRSLFEDAKRNSPSIIFIDEIDAVGRHRGAGLGGGHDEREQTLNQILVEMDGFETNTNVIVIAATNRPDILDPALLRPGRFDRRIVIDLPDINGREAILKIHVRGKSLAPSVNLESLAKETAGFSGADLANLVNEAAILAARRNRNAIEMADLEEAMERVIAGPERRSRRISPKEKEITAYHEAGHALVARLLPNTDPVHKISIIARGMSLGHTLQLPSEDRYLLTYSHYHDMIATYLGGRVAEELIFGEISTGAAQDIKEATALATKMVTEYGMSHKLGPRTFGNRQEPVFLGREIVEQRDYGDRVANLIDDEVNEIIREGEEVARRLLEANKDRLKFIAERLIIEETLEGERLEAAFEGRVPPESPKPVEPEKEKSVKKPRPVLAPDVLRPGESPA